MKFKVETFPNYRIAYIRRVGQYGPANIEVMEKVKKWAKEKNLLESGILFAIPQDNPESTLPDNCKFDACIVIPNDYQVDDLVLKGNFLVESILFTKLNIHQMIFKKHILIYFNHYNIMDIK